jgi:hypothetical protein
VSSFSKIPQSPHRCSQKELIEINSEDRLRLALLHMVVGARDSLPSYRTHWIDTDFLKVEAEGIVWEGNAYGSF